MSIIKTNSKGGTAASNKNARYAEGANRQPQSHEMPRRPRRKKSGSIGFMLAGVIIAAVFLAAAMGSMYVNGLETIFPNVTFAGVDVGNMTITQAGDALEQGGFGSGDEGVSVELPAGHTLEILANEATTDSTPIEAAEKLYSFGRDGNAISNLMTYLKCLISGYSPIPGKIMSIDEAYVKQAVTDEVQKVNAELMGSGLDIGETELTIIKGARSVIIDESAVYTLVMNALESGDYGELSYTPQNTGGEDLDLQSVYETVRRDPVNSEYNPETKSATEHVTGLDFDLPEAQRLWDSASPGQKVVIPLIVTEPEITTEYLNSRLFSGVLAQKNTSLAGSSASRINNVTKACKSVNGMVLNPGDEFSYNTALGKRTAEAGYKPAGAYSGGEVVQEIGGGICQVSSTLYYCALYSNLEITARTGHYFPVSYLPAGLDATVSWGGPEFKFVNDREYPIKIVATVEGGYCKIKLLGTDEDGSYVKMTTDSWLNSDGSTGVTSYRSVYDKDGNLLSKTKESGSRYHVHKEAESPEPSASPSPSPTPTPTPMPTPTPTPSLTATPEVSPSPTISGTDTSGTDIITENTP